MGEPIANPEVKQWAGFFTPIVLLVLAASGAYLAERQVQPEKFDSTPEAMWWATATLTTLGYGGVVGIGMAALTKQHRIALGDNVSDADEEQEFEVKRRGLGLSKRIVEEIRAGVQRKRSGKLVGRCPHCGWNLNRRLYTDA